MFQTEDVLWISQHLDLVGDPVLGAEAPLRFRPSRFNLAGDALDGRDVACQLLACPRCHLGLPRALTETPAVFISIVGAPASGKSHFLTSMTWALRRQLAHGFGVAFNDADGSTNGVLHEYEEALFLPTDTKQLVAVKKTELQGDLYDRVNLDGQSVQLPKPFLFTLRPDSRAGESSAAGARAKQRRVRALCLYDNAGEHFQPGMDTATSPGTQHLARSRAILFLYDPTQHPRFRERCRTVSQDPQLEGPARAQRQETLLTEAAARVRRFAGLSAQARHDRPLIVVVSKADIWGPLVKLDLSREPVLGSQAGRDWVFNARRLEGISAQLRKLLMFFSPEFVTAAEDFCSEVVYVPVSALGRGPVVDASTGRLGVPAADIHPQWVTAPLLYVLARWVPGMVRGNSAD